MSDLMHVTHALVESFFHWYLMGYLPGIKGKMKGNEMPNSVAILLSKMPSPWQRKSSTW
jgi:hypothetical protein